MTSIERRFYEKGRREGGAPDRDGNASPRYRSGPGSKDLERSINDVTMLLGGIGSRRGRECEPNPDISIISKCTST
jgi:hypothetical protein